ncbi:MAG: ABC transporter substrate-binding protein [Chloroflexi bacterium]|nr:ABC transporter substrate-binding protein [Chloroflexota bacterium]
MLRVALGNSATLVVLMAVSAIVISCVQPAPATPTPVPKPVATAQPAPAAPPKPTAAPAAAAKQTEVSTVRVTDLGLTSDGFAYIARERGYFKEQGIEAELVRFDTSAKTIAPMAAGQLEVGRGSPTAGLFNAITRDVPIKIVADGSRIVNNNYMGLVARKDLLDSGAIKDYADLKGKNIGLLAKATGNEIDIDRAARKGNLTLKDVSLVELTFPDMIVALSNKAIDVALMPEPNVTIARERGVGALWKLAHEFTPDHQLSMLMYAPSFVKDKPEVAKRFMVAYVKGIRDFYDAFFKNKNKSETIAIIAKHAAIKDPAVYEKMVMHGIDPNGYVNAKSVMADQDWFVANGYSKERIDEKVLIDNQFVDYAVQQLGKYQ